MKRKLRHGGCERPKAFWGAVIGAAGSILGSVINANAAERQAEEQAREKRRANAITEAQSLATAMNTQVNAQNEYENRFRREYERGGSIGGKNVVIKNGDAVPVGDGLYLLRGASHKNGGIDIDIADKKIEAEGGETIKLTPTKATIFSDKLKLPRRGNVTPADATLLGYNPNVIEAEQNAANKTRKHHLRHGRDVADRGLTYYFQQLLNELGLNKSSWKGMQSDLKNLGVLSEPEYIYDEQGNIIAVDEGMAPNVSRMPMPNRAAINRFVQQGNKVMRQARQSIGRQATKYAAKPNPVRQPKIITETKRPIIEPTRPQWNRQGLRNLLFGRTDNGVLTIPKKTYKSPTTTIDNYNKYDLWVGNNLRNPAQPVRRFDAANAVADKLLEKSIGRLGSNGLATHKSNLLYNTANQIRNRRLARVLGGTVLGLSSIPLLDRAYNSLVSNYNFDTQAEMPTSNPNNIVTDTIINQPLDTYFTDSTFVNSTDSAIANPSDTSVVIPRDSNIVEPVVRQDTVRTDTIPRAEARRRRNETSRQVVQPTTTESVTPIAGTNYSRVKRNNGEQFIQDNTTGTRYQLDDPAVIPVVRQEAAANEVARRNQVNQSSPQNTTVLGGTTLGEERNMDLNPYLGNVRGLQTYDEFSANPTASGLSYSMGYTPTFGSRQLTAPNIDETTAKYIDPNSTTRVSKSPRSLSSGMSLTGADIANAGIGIAGSLISNAILRSAYNNLDKYAPNRPIAYRDGKLITNYNINPQLAAIDYNTARVLNEIKRNRISSGTALNDSATASNAATLAKSEQYGIKTNKEIELMNADTANQQEVANKNIEAYNNWQNARNEYLGSIARAKAASNVGLVQGIGSSLSNMIQSASDRYNDENALIAYVAGSEKGNIEKLINMGYPLSQRVLRGVYNNNPLSRQIITPLLTRRSKRLLGLS